MPGGRPYPPESKIAADGEGAGPILRAVENLHPLEDVGSEAQQVARPWHVANGAVIADSRAVVEGGSLALARRQLPTGLRSRIA